MRAKNKVLLQRVLDEIEVIEAVRAETDGDGFLGDKIKQHAVVMAL